MELFRAYWPKLNQMNWRAIIVFQILSGTKFNLSGLRVDFHFWPWRLWGGRNTHTRAHEISRRCDAKGAPKIFGANFASRLLEISRARVCISPAPTIAIAKITDYS